MTAETENLTQHVELAGERDAGGTVVVRILASEDVDTFEALLTALNMVSPERLAPTLMELDPIRFAEAVGE
ncbi:hypothetical protein [Puerhibacterium puerhi]|uniref:hypothetical protein n=1 Tax=Puerhibacterium puerhi TaxID=2692623 RepID=UPI001359B4D5|nr:hypothetical protein [Puerhibacterium puerhi]